MTAVRDTTVDSPAVIVVRDYLIDEQFVIGPFESGTDASRYGFKYLDKEDWYWLPLNAPLPPRREV